MHTIDQFAKQLEQIKAGVLEARAMRKAYIGPEDNHPEDRELSMSLNVDETTSLGLSIEVPTSLARGDLSWLASVATFTLANPEMGLCCLVFLFPKPVIHPSPIYTLLDCLCIDLDQNDLNMQCMPVATYGGWLLAKPISLQHAQCRE